MRTHDLKVKLPFALTNSKSDYKKKIHQAVTDNGELDPYTGEKLDWGLIARQKPLPGAKTAPKKYRIPKTYSKTFAMLPVVDHIDPEQSEVLEFEICSWIINECKTYLNPDDFVEVCRKVADYRKISEPAD